MPTSLDGQLVVAISSRALFDFEEENRHFEAHDDRAYMRLQLERLDLAARPGVAFSLVNKLLAFNAVAPRVEVVILSRNDPVSGMRVFRSAQHYGLPIQRGVFTRGESPWRYLRPLNAHLFLSTNEADVRSALGAGVPAARVYPHSARASAEHPDEVRIAFDGDAVLFSDEAERVFQRSGLVAFQTHERDHSATPLAAGPFKPLLAGAAPLQQAPTHDHAHPHRARHRPQRAGARARDSHADGLEHRGRRGDVPGRPAEGRVPARVRARLLLRRPDRARRRGGARTCPRGTWLRASATVEAAGRAFRDPPYLGEGAGPTGRRTLHTMDYRVAASPSTRQVFRTPWRAAKRPSRVNQPGCPS